MKIEMHKKVMFTYAIVVIIGIRCVRNAIAIDIVIKVVGNAVTI